ncbi:MAG: hypothetical protein FWC33_01080 [Candidatus Bathyarchaeota archaeon]|nr:hypothetical protein [Candidatus Termiticorpusculum sp.]
MVDSDDLKRQHTPVVTPVTTVTGPQSRNFGYSIEERICHVIDASEVELKPSEIARKIHAPHKPTAGQYTSVRVICARLLQRGLVIQPYPGTYCSKITYGVRFVPLMLHNIRLHSNLCMDVKSEVISEVVGGIGIKVVFGSERRKVSGVISCDAGMSRDACLFAVNRWFELVEKKLGFCLNDLVLTTWELNKDHAGIRIDGIQCVTKRDLYGMIERTYQKEENLVRKEWKISTPMSLNKFEEAVSKGLAGIEKAQDLKDLRDEVRGVWKALKFNNSRMLELGRCVEAISKSQLNMVDRFVDLEKGLTLLSNTVSRLFEVLAGNQTDKSSVSEHDDTDGFEYVR